MPIISMEIMKRIDEREKQKRRKEKQTKTERSKGTRSYTERVTPKLLCCAFKLGFLHLICKASSIFKSNLEIALSYILNYMSQSMLQMLQVECRCFKKNSLNFSNYLNNKDPNIKCTKEKEINHSIAFLDAFISVIKNQNITLQTSHKSTYTKLLLNFRSFTLFPNKIS